MPETVIDEKDLLLERYDNVFVLTMRKAPENRINSAYAQRLITAYNTVRKLLGEDAEGAIITKGNDAKFWCTGLELDEADSNPYANSEGFYPLLATIMDFPFPTIALITGHTFGGAGPFALSHDYRVMNSKRGFISMPPVNLGLHFPGIGALPRLKLSPQVARKMLLEAHRWTGEQALNDGIVDQIAEPDKMLDVAMELAKRLAPKAKMGVFSHLRNELYGDAGRAFREISYIHGRLVGTAAKAKI
ncbi:Putative enoyl-CoA hydratase/isomerase, ClpP/crotonase-like domain superfamily [Septoria linicola]|uniref:Enoyl-CoA hydratase/isomerase, ClpP/crotonase-like domain superfamily n=1 Tax=Septoria linicola TaxID=215465 RepID=A0A9Q9ALL9_9PEZI|nr:putative enoyl-CoA hydratase/isomerase, ClpP/crotonase-like domain superfamily [Septoria linicola]USW48267.1 Putative enoyl-CoA hydratase/isomerase, ClpP/crotonase-like domain superfamily [Septoria linicola]